MSAGFRLSFFYLLCLFLAAPHSPLHADSAPETRPPQTLVVMGDSIAAGYGVEPDEAFPALLQQKIDKAGLNFQVVNAGLSGDTTAGGLRRITWLLRRPIDVLLLELGGNDGLRGIPPPETQRNLAGIIEKTRAKYPDVKIVLAGMQMPDNMGQEYTEAFEAIFPAVAEAQEALLIPFLLEGVGGKAELNQEDRIHPTAAGHRIVAQNAWEVLEPLLRETQPR